MVFARRFRAGFVTVMLGLVTITPCLGADATSDDPQLFAAGFASEFGFTLGESLEARRKTLPAPKPQDNGNLYFVLKLPKPNGPFEQVVVGMSPKSQLVVTLRARREFNDAAACVVELQKLNEAMQLRLGVKSTRSSVTQSRLFYNVEKAPVSREMSCNDKRLDFYVFDKKLISQSVSESVEAEETATVATHSKPTAQR